MRVISLGWGVQSFTLAAMSALGDLPSVDVAIHADTTHERSATYDFAARWTPWLEERGVHVVTVRAQNTHPLRGKAVMIPAFSGDSGMIRRQCTTDWKIKPIHRWLKRELKVRGIEQIELWLGISMDEVARAKSSREPWIVHRFPLLERRMSRASCEAYLRERGIEVPGRSACVFCPFQTAAEWRELIHRGGEDLDKAIAVDELIRDARPPGQLFVARGMPLRELARYADIQGELFGDWQNECEGHCGL